jgi:hypothetical protein
MWASSQARAVWEPRITTIQQAWLRVEVESVRQGLRPAGLVFGLPQVSGLPLTPVAENRYAIGPAAADLAMAFRNSDNQQIGKLLGYPPCCRDFFDRTWGLGLIDTTAQMEGDGNGPVECNILGRWLGVRFVMHLPCSWQCPHTRACAERWKPLWPREPLQWAREILSWPTQWSARNGIAEVVFPVCKLSTRTTPGETTAIRRAGVPPDEASTGVAFPFNEPRRRAPVLIQLTDPAKANGFSTLEAMTAAHAMLLEELESNPPQGLTVDLGCGNGRLMRRIGQQFDVPVLGVEVDPSRAQGAADIRLTNIEAFDTLPHDADTLVVSLRRFEEIPDLEHWAATHARQVLVYSYDPPMFAEMKRGLR